jgi:predicted MFS family arabinose efflux permease
MSESLHHHPLPTAFRRLAWSNLIAQSADQIGLAATPMIAVLVLGAGAGATGFLTAAQTLPFLLLSFPAGVLADRTSRRSLMALAEALRCVALLSLPMLAGLAWLSVPLLALIGFAAATGTVAFSVAAPALVPALVPRQQFVAANGRLELARSVAFAAGPALAGALVGWLGASPTFILAAALSAIAAALLIGIPEPQRPAQVPRHIVADLKEGAGFVWRHEWLRPILLTAVAWNLAWFVLQAAYVPYAVHRLGLSATGVGATLAVYGIGMVAGALLAPRVVASMSFGSAVALGPVVSVAAIAVMLATLQWPSGALAAVSFFLFGAGPIVWVISSTTLRQAVTPEALLGRVTALFMTANTGARPVGAALGGLIGGAYGAEACIVVACIGFLIQAAIILRSPIRSLARLPAMA